MTGSPSGFALLPTACIKGGIFLKLKIGDFIRIQGRHVWLSNTINDVGQVIHETVRSDTGNRTFQVKTINKCYDLEDSTETGIRVRDIRNDFYPVTEFHSYTDVKVQKIPVKDFSAWPVGSILHFLIFRIDPDGIQTFSRETNPFLKISGHQAKDLYYGRLYEIPSDTLAYQEPMKVRVTRAIEEPGYYWGPVPNPRVIGKGTVRKYGHIQFRFPHTIRQSYGTMDRTGRNLFYLSSDNVLLCHLSGPDFYCFDRQRIQVRHPSEYLTPLEARAWFPATCCTEFTRDGRSCFYNVLTRADSPFPVSSG